MVCRSAVLALSLAVLSSASAFSHEACDAKGTCDAAKGSAMLQVKSEEVHSKKAFGKHGGVDGYQSLIQADNHAQRSCISIHLRKANKNARSKNGDGCGAGPVEVGKACTKQGVPGQCKKLPAPQATDYSHEGSEVPFFCDIGQAEACKDKCKQVSMGMAECDEAQCTVHGGIVGTCQQTGTSGVVSGNKPIIECKIVDQEAPTTVAPQEPKPEPEPEKPTPTTVAPTEPKPEPEPEKPTPTTVAPEEPKPEPEPEKPTPLPGSLQSHATAGSKVLEVTSNTGFSSGQDIVIDAGTAIEEYNKIVSFGSLILASPLQYDHGTGAIVTPASSVGVGSTASLDAGGFKAVTSFCCPMETESFFNRLLDKEGYDVCSKPHIQGLMHWFSCVPDMDFKYVLDVIANGNPCKYWSPKGVACPVLSAACRGEWCR